jgi:hypothetical protein
MSKDSSGMQIQGRKNPQVFHKMIAHTILPQVNTIIINCMNNAQTPTTQLIASCSKPDHNINNFHKRKLKTKCKSVDWQSKATTQIL